MAGVRFFDGLFCEWEEGRGSVDQVVMCVRW